jgi:hypothetical protein
MFNRLLPLAGIVSFVLAAIAAARGVIWLTEAHPRVVVGLMAVVALWLGRPGHGLLKG